MQLTFDLQGKECVIVHLKSYSLALGSIQKVKALKTWFDHSLSGQTFNTGHFPQTKRYLQTSFIATVHIVHSQIKSTA